MARTKSRSRKSRSRSRPLIAKKHHDMILAILFIGVIAYLGYTFLMPKCQNGGRCGNVSGTHTDQANHCKKVCCSKKWVQAADGRKYCGPAHPIPATSKPSTVEESPMEKVESANGFPTPLASIRI